MVDSLIDPKLEIEMAKIKQLLESLKRSQTIFMNTFSKMKPRERAAAAKEISSNHAAITNFIGSARKYDLRAPTLKFGLENIRQKFQLLSDQWRRTEKLMDSGSSGAPNRPEIAEPARLSSLNPTENAVEKYVQSLKTLGHKATPEMVDEFKNRLEAAYKNAKEKSGGRDLDIHIVQDGGKIKVRMEPK